MCSDCREWKQSGLDRRDFRQSKDGPEEITRHPKRRNKRWCKGKTGREHEWEKVLWYTYQYKDTEGNTLLGERHRWACKGCGKSSYWRPPQPVPKHNHCYCVTKIATRWKCDEIYEECCVCGGRGRKYSFFK